MLANESMKKNPRKVVHDDRLRNYMLDLQRKDGFMMHF
jgi:hypothetical protein